ncbi:hypothetical protein BJX99DRAFT_244635 [Aspergillus californicus]
MSSLEKESFLDGLLLVDTTHLSSYNWIEASTPTTAVPGSPAIWTPPDVAANQVKQDSGLIYISQNAARHSENPLEALFRALYITQPSYDIRSVDLVTERNSIRKLLSFVNPVAAGKKWKQFTIDETSSVIEPHEFVGYGHEFEKAYTTEQVEGTLKIIAEGQDVTIDSILELKTRTINRLIPMSEDLAQLWVSQTPNLVRAYHKGGLFVRSRVKDDLGNLARLIREIISVVKKSGGSAVVKYDKKDDKLVISKGERKKMLPADLYSKFET